MFVFLAKPQVCRVLRSARYRPAHPPVSSKVVGIFPPCPLSHTAELLPHAPIPTWEASSCPSATTGRMVLLKNRCLTCSSTTHFIVCQPEIIPGTVMPAYRSSRTSLLPGLRKKEQKSGLFMGPRVGCSSHLLQAARWSWDRTRRLQMLAEIPRKSCRGVTQSRATPGFGIQPHQPFLPIAAPIISQPPTPKLVPPVG